MESALIERGRFIHFYNFQSALSDNFCLIFIQKYSNFGWKLFKSDHCVSKMCHMAFFLRVAFYRRRYGICILCTPDILCTIWSISTFQIKDYIFLTFRDCWRKFATGIFVHNPRTVNPRVKSYARGQNNGSGALKWGIVHLCASITFRNTWSFVEIWVF